ncbi:uncharacterized protein LOC127783742, partial [Oryza glaberrima]|uniref:uncharacterized protein LOC127783742 n=1 Tax=Oryza glaberrima TaxID=4538 RepID=UPI00224BFA0F
PSLRSLILAPSHDLPWSLATSPPSSPLSRAAGRLQPPLPPRQHAGRPCRRLLQRRSRLLFAGLPSVSHGDHRRRVLTGVQWRYRHCTTSSRLCRFAGASAFVVAAYPGTGTPSSSPANPRRRLYFAGTPSPAPPLPRSRRHPLRQPLPPCQCAGRRRRLHLRHRSGKVALGLASPSTEPHRCSSSSSSFLLAGSLSRCAASVVGIAAVCSTPSSHPCSCCRLPSSPPRRPRSSSLSSSRRSRSSWRSSLRQAVLVRRPRPSSEPLQPRHRLRPRLRVVKSRAGRVSPSSKDRRRSRPLAVRLRRSRPSPPRPFVVVVPTPRRVVGLALLVCFA